MPLCRDCAHCVPDQDARDPYLDARCSKVTYVDQVSGEERMIFCGIERSSRLGGSPCGLEGKLFEPRDADEGKTPTDAVVSA